MSLFRAPANVRRCANRHVFRRDVDLRPALLWRKRDRSRGGGAREGGKVRNGGKVGKRESRKVGNQEEREIGKGEEGEGKAGNGGKEGKWETRKNARSGDRMKE